MIERCDAAADDGGSGVPSAPQDPCCLSVTWAIILRSQSSSGCGPRYVDIQGHACLVSPTAQSKHLHRAVLISALLTGPGNDPRALGRLLGTAN